MKKNILILIACFALGTFTSNSQSIFGKWKTIDDETGNEKSIVEIYKVDGKAYAKILQLLEKGKEDKLCDKCNGDKKNKPINFVINVMVIKKINQLKVWLLSMGYHKIMMNGMMPKFWIQKQERNINATLL